MHNVNKYFFITVNNIHKDIVLAIYNSLVIFYVSKCIIT